MVVNKAVNIIATMQPCDYNTQHTTA